MSDREQRKKLADLILRRRPDIEQRWLGAVRGAVPDDDLTMSELRDSIPDYLLRVAEALRQPEPIEVGGSTSWAEVAREHAADRARQGFDIDQLVREFILLRRVLFDIISEEIEVIDLQSSTALSDLIEGAMAEAVKSYVLFRDHAARKQEAEHVGFLTHELRTPLSTAKLALLQARRGLPPGSEQNKFFDVCDRSLEKLRQLIDGVLLVQRDAHELKPRMRPIELRQLLEQPLTSARLAAEAKQLQFEAVYDPNATVTADPDLCHSALENLLHNAVKYTDTGKVALQAEMSANETVIHVRDTGPGIRESEIAQIFEPFSRGRSGKPGSGLGLAIARRAIEAQGGKIHVESVEAHGTHFWVTLPRSPAAAA